MSLELKLEELRDNVSSEYLYELLKNLAESAKIVVNKYVNDIFVHVDFESAERLVDQLIKSAGSISVEVLEAAEEIHPVLGGKIMEELVKKTKLDDIIKKLGLGISRVYLVVDNKKGKKLPNMKKINDIYVGYPGSAEEISKFFDVLEIKKQSGRLATNIARAAIANLILKAKEFEVLEKNYTLRAHVIIWVTKKDDKLIKEVEESLRS